MERIFLEYHLVKVLRFLFYIFSGHCQKIPLNVYFLLTTYKLISFIGMINICQVSMNFEYCLTLKDDFLKIKGGNWIKKISDRFLWNYQVKTYWITTFKVSKNYGIFNNNFLRL